MAIRLNLKKDMLANEKESVLHLMPCDIHGDEPALVSSYFTPYIRKKDDERECPDGRRHPSNYSSKRIFFRSHRSNDFVPRLSSARKDRHSTEGLHGFRFTRVEES